MRTKRCDPSVRSGRLTKAIEFSEAAQIIDVLADEAGDVADAYVTLCVHAGIAAADVLCCARLGEHAQGENHNDAVALLERVDHALARHLRTLLDLKTRAGYSHSPVSADATRRAGRAMEALVLAARATSTG